MAKRREQDPWTDVDFLKWQGVGLEFELSLASDVFAVETEKLTRDIEHVGGRNWTNQLVCHSAVSYEDIPVIPEGGQNGDECGNHMKRLEETVVKYMFGKLQPPSERVCVKKILTEEQLYKIIKQVEGLITAEWLLKAITAKHPKLKEAEIYESLEILTKDVSNYGHAYFRRAIMCTRTPLEILRGNYKWMDVNEFKEQCPEQQIGFFKLSHWGFMWVGSKQGLKLLVKAGSWTETWDYFKMRHKMACDKKYTC